MLVAASLVVVIVVRPVVVRGLGVTILLIPVRKIWAHCRLSHVWVLLLVVWAKRAAIPPAVVVRFSGSVVVAMVVTRRILATVVVRLVGIGMGVG